MDVIRKFIYNKIQGENVPGISIDDDVELVENRVVTSLVLIQIITGIEDIIENRLLPMMSRSKIFYCKQYTEAC